MNRPYNAIVIGLGAMGSAALFHLARRGRTVLGLERFDIPHDRGSSHGETRNIRQAVYENPAYVPLLKRAFDLWQELAAGTGRPLMRLTGRVMMGRPDGSVIRGALASADRFGLPVERLSPDEIRRRFPMFAPRDDMVGLYEARAGVLFAETCVGAQHDAARAAGATLRFDEALLDWRSTAGGLEIRTTRDRYAASQLILATGAWLPALVPGLPLWVERQVLCWFEPRARPESFAPDRCPIYLFQIAPDWSLYGVQLFGDGIKVARHHGGERCTPDSVRRSVDASDVEPVRAAVERYLPDAAGPFLRSRVCLYTNTPDLHFIIDRHSSDERVLLVSSCSGHGFKFAPAIGEAVAQLALDGSSAVDLSFFRLARFQS